MLMKFSFKSSGLGPRYPQPQNVSKQAIQTMLRARQPGTSGYMPQNQAIQSLQMIQKQRQTQMVRHRLQQQFHQQNPQSRLADTQGLYGNSVPGTNQPSGMMQISQCEYFESVLDYSKYFEYFKVFFRKLWHTCKKCLEDMREFCLKSDLWKMCGLLV